MATEPVENELDCVLEDVWIEVLLPLLSIRDIFQLCAVNRRIRELLLKECTFRRLCQVSSNVQDSCVRVFGEIWFQVESVSSKAYPFYNYVIRFIATSEITCPYTCTS